MFAEHHVKIMLYLLPDLKDEFQAACIDEERSMNKQITYLIKKWLDERAQQEYARMRQPEPEEVSA